MLCPEVLLDSGGFNFDLDDPSDADARKLMELMDTLLDLIISRSSNVVNIFPPKSTYYISDRRFAECQLSIPGPNMLIKEVSYQKFKQIDMDNFRSDTVDKPPRTGSVLGYHFLTVTNLGLSRPREYQDSDCKTKSAVVQFGTEKKKKN